MSCGPHGDGRRVLRVVVPLHTHLRRVRGHDHQLARSVRGGLQVKPREIFGVSDPGREATSGRSKDSRLDRSLPRKRARLESPQRCGSSGGSGGGSACGGAAPPRHWTEAEESESENHGDMGGRSSLSSFSVAGGGWRRQRSYVLVKGPRPAETCACVFGSFRQKSGANFTDVDSRQRVICRQAYRAGG